MSQGYRLAEKLNNYDMDVTVVISGGVEKNGVFEAEVMYEVAKRECLDFENVAQKVILEKESVNTLQNVLKTMKYVRDLDAEIIYAVSSKDHAPRVLRDWTYIMDEHNFRQEVVITGVPSMEAYSVKGDTNPPFIVEPPFWAYDSLQEIFKVPANKKEYVARAIRDVIQGAISN